MKKKCMLISVITASIIGAALASYLIYFYLARNDLTKDNIFQIPGTTYEYTIGHRVFHEEYYFIQKYPCDEKELKAALDSFVKSNNILSNISSDVSYMLVNFMVPDSRLPIWFEQNKNYWVMDDYISNYKTTNRIALYTLNNEDKDEEVDIFIAPHDGIHDNKEQCLQS